MIPALLLPLLAACGGGEGEGTRRPTTGSPPPEVELGAVWTTRLAGPRGSQNGMVLANDHFIAVGDGAGVQASTDGRVWSVTTSTVTRLDDIARDRDGDRMVALNGSFWVLTSDDGLAWTKQVLPQGANTPRGLARSNTVWVAVGDGGSILSSPDGITWTKRESGTSSNLRSVAWGGSLFVAVGADGAVTTSADGVSWTNQIVPTKDSFTAVGSTPSMFVATTFPYSGSTSALLTSPDGASWTPRVTGLPSFNRVIYAGDQLVGVGQYSSSTSPDGLVWDTTGVVPGTAKAVVHAGTEYVAAGTDRNASGAIFSSPDGLSWSMVAADHDLKAIARRPSDGLLLAVGSDTVRASSDGGETWRLDWLTPNLSENYLILDVVWSESAAAFIALVQVAANQHAYRSTDGRTFTSLGPIPCRGGLAVSPTGLLLSTGTSLTGPCVATSSDGETWTPGTPAPGGQLQEAYWIGTQFLAVGTNGALATSADGASWTSLTSGVDTTLKGAAASPTTLVVVGDKGTIVTSVDGGSTWTPRESGESSALRRVIWTGSEFVAVGSAGRLLRSADGMAWKTQATPYTASPNAFDLNDILWVPDGDGEFVLVGTHGLVATSK